MKNPEHSAADSTPPRDPAPRALLTARLVGTALGILLVAAVGGALLASDANATIAGLFLLIAVLAVAGRGGAVAGGSSALAAGLLYNVGFLPPRGTLHISGIENWVAFLAFLVAAALGSRLLGEATEQAEAAQAREREVDALHRVAVAVFSETRRSDRLVDLASRAFETLGVAEGGLLAFGENPTCQELLFWLGSPGPGEADRRQIATVAIHRTPLELGKGAERRLLAPVLEGERVVAVLFARHPNLSKNALVSVARLVEVGRERERLVEERLSHEALRKSEELKTSLLRAISHDLVTPLASITLEADALRRHPGDPRAARERIDRLVGETARLRRRIESLLALARLEAGLSSPRAEPTPPGDLFRMVREATAGLLGTVPLEATVEPGCPDLFVDASLAVEILANLVENSRRATESGEPVEIRARKGGDGRVELGVLDRGRGLERPAVERASGGLGLEIVRSLARLSGGTFRLEPRAGGGAEAWVGLPAARVEEEGETG
jgi:two-component system sensor histidine kinase KdpD